MQVENESKRRAKLQAEIKQLESDQQAWRMKERQLTQVRNSPHFFQCLPLYICLDLIMLLKDVDRFS